jgi:hypothetical protein
MGAKQSGVGVLNKVEDWKLRAKGIRAIAQTMLDGGSRECLLQIADDWDQMAKLAEEGTGIEENIAAGTEVTLAPSEDEFRRQPRWAT